VVVLGVSLRFIQESRPTMRRQAQGEIKSATVTRGGRAKEIPIAHLVPGDVTSWRGRHDSVTCGC